MAKIIELAKLPKGWFFFDSKQIYEAIEAIRSRV